MQITPVDRLIGLVGRVFANCLGDLSSVPGRVIPKTLKMVLDASLPNTQHYKVSIKCKVEKSTERNSALEKSCYRKGTFLVALDYGHQLYFTLLRVIQQYLKPFNCVQTNALGLFKKKIRTKYSLTNHTQTHTRVRTHVCVCARVCVYTGTSVVEQNSFQNYIRLSICSKI